MSLGRREGSMPEQRHDVVDMLRVVNGDAVAAASRKR
jgi:hypothetical protein